MATAKILGSKIMSSGGNPISSVKILYALVHTLTFLSYVSACPCSSKAITMTAAPYFLTSKACRLNSSSPSFIERELTIPFPCIFFRPISNTDHLEESNIIGTFAISGSDAMSRRNISIAFSESKSPSSIFISII